MTPEERGEAAARAVLPTAAALVCAVIDEDRVEIERLLETVTDWRALVVVLAANIDDSQPLANTVRSLSEEGRAIKIITRAAAVTGVPVELILSPRRDRLVTDARAVAMYACHLAGLTYSGIGRAFDRDHSTAIYAVTRVGENPDLRRLAGRVTRELGIPRPTDQENAA